MIITILFLLIQFIKREHSIFLLRKAIEISIDKNLGLVKVNDSKCIGKFYYDEVPKIVKSKMLRNENYNETYFKKSENAIPIADQAIKHDPKNRFNYVNYAEILAQLGRYTESAKYYEKAINIAELQGKGNSYEIKKIIQQETTTTHTATVTNSYLHMNRRDH